MDQRRLEYLQRILNSRVYDIAIESPLDRASKLSARLDNDIWLKREDTQPVHSFKLRGAYNKMAHLSAEELARGVICSSAGNHAQGVAMSAQRLGCDAHIVMPVTTPKLKSDAVRALGGKVVLHGESYTEAFAHAVELEKQHGYLFVHPFDDPDVIAGQGTIGMEILRQHQHSVHAVFVAIGGGGLISGVAAYIKAVRPGIKVIGVQMKDSDAMVQSVRAGHKVALNDVGLFSDGTAVKVVGDETFRLTSELVDDFVTVDTDAVCAAIKDAFEDTRSILEPAGAMGIAGLKQYVAEHQLTGQTLVAITCGANMNFDRLRFVADRAEAGEEREALFAVTIPEVRGSFKRLCETVSQRDVTEFSYRITDGDEAHVLVGLSIKNRSEVTAICDSLTEQRFSAISLVEDDLAKEHLRYMVGGRSSVCGSERLYRFEFPERPGALMRFLSSMHPNWNISLFHYRNHGADYGRILIGIQIPDEDLSGFQEFVETLGYRYTDETANPVYHMFLR
ncbi:threonine ammonia-lyase, biosynthetic [Rhodopirellula sp. MGV]|uniref:threonine ammonia-lyase, biosynthetic n=1 Tax=Rhodopirellula sp. MGV TaxID=2023130 RepID=UPI000B9613BA|nr:threonine ammonia-lyase, biosynthetic [Rhodopirellula sp. MGV]OYP34355.1 threonine ammonia-lyase, biosynthetic [Rhodopirellula sp. MGV]PNY35243.1 threonine ammonia-lyase, biosynthetic [Rhodopirellula baltica]